MVNAELLIDCRGIPNGSHSRRCLHKIHKKRQEICDELLTIEDRQAVCFHEIGHLTYSRRTNYLTEPEKTDSRIFGPRMFYNEKTYCFDGSPGSVGLVTEQPYSPIQTYNEDILFEMAKIVVAGAEFVQFFMRNRHKLGDTKDLDTFKDHYEIVAKNLADVDLRPLSVLLKDAKEAVYRDLLGDADLQVSTRADAEKLELLFYTSPFDPLSPPSPFNLS
jgi:hypothetical protein